MADQPLLHDRYRVLRRLGRGAFATVYLAEDTLMERLVAVKAVPESLDADGRALREAKAAAKLNHPHIVHVFEVVAEQGRTLLFTEYVEGRTLRTLYVGRRLDDRQIIEIGIQVCRALEHGHKRGVIHRDIKPENLMLLEGEEIDVRVMDFGVAHLEDQAGVTREGDVVGTLAYMAPEQLAGEPVDARADVYALCVTLYEGLTGTNPLRGKSLRELVNSPGIQQLEPLRRVRPDLPPLLDEALHGGLSPDPERRLDAASLRRYLERSLKQLPEPAETGAGARRRAAGLLISQDRLERMAFAGRHLLGGGLALAATNYLLQRSSLFPAEWDFPLVAGAGFLALLFPTLGAGAVLLLFAVEALVYGLGWGLLVVVTAAPLLFLLSRSGRGWGILLPMAAPWLASTGLGLLIPPLAGHLLRRWGFVVAFLAGLVVSVAAGLEGWSQVPFVYSVDLPAVLAGSRYAGPVQAVEHLVRLLDAAPFLLLQAVLFAVFAFPPGRLVVASREPLDPRRQWGTALYLSAFWAAFVLLPPLVTGVIVDLGGFFLAYIPCVIIVSFFGLLVPSQDPHTSTER